MRPVNVSAVQLWSDALRTPAQNREHAFVLADRAALANPDLVVLPEAIAMLCYPDGRPDFTYHDVAEAVPGSSTARLAEIARLHNTNIVAGLIEDRGPEAPCQNVTVVINRKGQMVGTYEKIHEPQICRTEQAADVGNSIPVFDLDFGRIGIMVCWDLISPEIASILALKGAEIICLPHLIGLPSKANFAVQIRSRAIDTGLPIVAAGMRDENSHSGGQDGVFPTCIVDADGQVIAQTELSGADVVSATIDLEAASANREHIKRRDPDLRLELYSREYEGLARDRRNR